MKQTEMYCPELFPDFIMERFSNCLNSYTKSFNKVYHRKGALFIDYMRRAFIDDTKQLPPTIQSIHYKPVIHGLAKHIANWRWSSYNSLLSKAPTLLQRQTVLEWFDGIESLKAYHGQRSFLKHAIVFE